MLMSNLFLPLINLPILNKIYYEDAINAEYEEPNQFHDRCYHVSKRFSDSKLCYNLINKFGKLDGKILRINPSSGYNWHVDLHRKVGLNFLLGDENQNYLTLFRAKKDKLNFKIIRCEYTPYVPTLFNSLVEHCVLNLDENNSRYILSVDFNISANFNQVKEFLFNYTEEM